MATRSATPINAHIDFQPHSPTLLRILLIASLAPLALIACSSQLPQASSAHTQSSACQTSQLAFSLNDDDGRFNGMSHSGTALVLRNKGTTPCTIPAMPQPGFTNADGQPLAITAQASIDPRAGPKAPMLLASGASVTSDMRWVSGNVYNDGHCESPAFITLAFDQQTLSSRFSGQLCGPGAKPPTYTLTPFRPMAAATAKTLSYRCADGRSVQASYPDANTAVLTLDGQTHRLHTAVSADGARYVGEHWQWWTKGMHKARMAPLEPGQLIASVSGISCTAP